MNRLGALAPGMDVSDLTFSPPDKTFSVRERTLSVTDKTLSAPDKSLSEAKKTFSVTEKGFSTTAKTFSAGEKGTSEAEKGAPKRVNATTLPVYLFPRHNSPNFPRIMPNRPVCWDGLDSEGQPLTARPPCEPP